MKTATILTSWGTITLQESEQGLAECTLPFLSAEPTIPFRIEQISANTPATRFINKLLNGHASSLPTIDPPSGTEFQREIWNAISTIPYGKTQTYGELAKQIQRPNATRAVGTACGKNPIPLFIPCHRVIGTNGLHGFSAGLPWKKLLLTLERGKGGPPTQLKP